MELLGKAIVLSTTPLSKTMDFMEPSLNNQEKFMTNLE